MAEFFAEDNEFKFSPDEIALINKYRNLTDRNKLAIKSLISNLDNVNNNNVIQNNI